MMRFLAVAAVAALLRGCFAASADDWRKRIIYQVFTDRFARTDGSTSAPCDVTQNQYCGGTWKGLENNLDYIKDMGFTAVWISPITAQVPTGYHGYWQTALYTLNPHFGTAADLNSLAAALHARDMYLMVDVVPNHMGFAGCPDTVSYASLAPFNDASYYHPYCEIADYGNQTELEVCWLGDCSMLMPDLRTEDSTVAAEMNAWISELVSNYSVDGLRIDSVKNVHASSFFPPFCGAAGVFCMGEVSDGRAEYTYPYQRDLDAVLDYPLYYSLTRTFTQQTNMSDYVVALASCTQNPTSGCTDATLLGTFLENHDNPRFPFVNADLALAHNALAAVLLGDGIPIVYQGQEQHFGGGDDPGCREALWLSAFDTSGPLHATLKALAALRTHISSLFPTYLTTLTQTPTYTASMIQLVKPPVRAILSNAGSTAASTAMTTSEMKFTPGATVVEALSCATYGVRGDGEVDVRIMSGMPVVLVEEGVLDGSGLCGY